MIISVPVTFINGGQAIFRRGLRTSAPPYSFGHFIEPNRYTLSFIHFWARVRFEFIPKTIGNEENQYLPR
jgi:hypothetical protein